MLAALGQCPAEVGPVVRRPVAEPGGPFVVEESTGPVPRLPGPVAPELRHLGLLLGSPCRRQGRVEVGQAARHVPIRTMVRAPFEEMAIALCFRRPRPEQAVVVSELMAIHPEAAEDLGPNRERSGVVGPYRQRPVDLVQRIGIKFFPGQGEGCPAISRDSIPDGDLRRGDPEAGRPGQVAMDHPRPRPARKLGPGRGDRLGDRSGAPARRYLARGQTRRPGREQREGPRDPDRSGGWAPRVPGRSHRDASFGGRIGRGRLTDRATRPRVCRGSPRDTAIRGASRARNPAP